MNITSSRRIVVIASVLLLCAGPAVAVDSPKTDASPADSIPEDARAAISAVTRLWLDVAPGDKGDIGEERDMTKPSEGKPSGKGVIRLGNVSKPMITVFRGGNVKDNSAAVIVCPGGGYNILAYDLEGTEVC